MEGNLPNVALDVEEGGGGETDYSFAVDGVVGVPCIDWFL